MLIAGCSNAAGFEINGEEDCAYNRDNSFGNLLAKKLNLNPVNIALGSSSNPAIVRSVKEYFKHNPKPARVLVAFTELTRIDFPSPFEIFYEEMNPGVDWYNQHMDQFLQINSGWHGANDLERAAIPYWHDYQVRHVKMLWLDTIRLQWGLQEFLKNLKIPYTFCNTMDMYPNIGDQEWNQYCESEWEMIDTDNYLDSRDNSKGFYWYYKNLGYNNPKAKYWHHAEEPHTLYAEKLYKFIMEGTSG